jgi:purine-binding chemotaxis protein CheW
VDGRKDFPRGDRGSVETRKEVEKVTDQPTTQEQVQAAVREGQYLTFVLAEEVYGLEILKVREIIGFMDITTVPRTPEFIKGVINLRGKVIPVIDLRLKFGMPEVEATDQTCIIVVDVDGVEIGIVVDEVDEVLQVMEADIEDAPAFGASVDTDFILGMGKTNGKVTILLDIGRVLRPEEVAGVAGGIPMDE